MDSGDHSDQDQKHRRRLQDALPLETPLAPDQKVEAGVVGEESYKKSNGHNEGTKHISNPDKAPRSKSYFQVLFKYNNIFVSYIVFVIDHYCSVLELIKLIRAFLSYLDPTGFFEKFFSIYHNLTSCQLLIAAFFATIGSYFLANITNTYSPD